jgi:hypothetical protein
MTGTQAAIVDAMLEVDKHALEGALVSLTELREVVKAKWQISDEQYNQEIMKFSDTGKWALHLHAHKSRLSVKEKQGMVPVKFPDGRTEYAIGIALRAEDMLPWRSTKTVLK